MVKTITTRMEAAGFYRVRILPPQNFHPLMQPFGVRHYALGALPYSDNPAMPESPPPGFGAIAPFAQRNYYREAALRLKAVVAALSADLGAKKADFRIFSNSREPEKPLAAACGLGHPGRNSLIIAPQLGSRFIIAGLALPHSLEGETPGGTPEGPPGGTLGGTPGDSPSPEEPHPCARCSAEMPPCVQACPTAALPGDGSLIRTRCIQWYASGNEAQVPPTVAAAWGKRLYGCTACQDACPHNRQPIAGTATELGALPPFMDCQELLRMDDRALKARFKGTAMGLSWLGPQAIRRNARLAISN